MMRSNSNGGRRYIIFSIDLQPLGSTRFYFRYYYNFFNYKL